MTNKVIFHFTEEKNAILEKINFFKYKEKIETNYVCDIYGEFGYARQKNKNLDELLKELIWRIFDNDKQAYEITIVKPQKWTNYSRKLFTLFLYVALNTELSKKEK